MSADKHTHRAARVEMYADWLHHDADGLAFNLTMPAAMPPESGATAILATARTKLARALEHIDKAIAADRAANTEKEAAL